MATDRLRVGTAVALAFPRSPTITAMEAADLAAVSGGRFTFGLGSQLPRIVEARFSLACDHPAARMEDYVRAVRAVWAARRGEARRHEGPFYRITMRTFEARNVEGRARNTMSDPAETLPDPPILVAAVGLLMSRAAGRIADGAIGHPFASSTWLRDIVRPAIAAGLDDTGRSADACPIQASPLVAIAEHADAARRAAKLQLALYATTPNYAGILRHHGREASIREARRGFARGDQERTIHAIDDALLDGIAIAGRIDEARDRLALWEDIADTAVLIVPFYGVAQDFAREMFLAILDMFGARSRARPPAVSSSDG